MDLLPLLPPYSLQCRLHGVAMGFRVIRVLKRCLPECSNATCASVLVADRVAQTTLKMFSKKKQSSLNFCRGGRASIMQLLGNQPCALWLRRPANAMNTSVSTRVSLGKPVAVWVLCGRCMDLFHTFISTKDLNSCSRSNKISSAWNHRCRALHLCCCWRVHTLPNGVLASSSLHVHLVCP